MTTEDHVQRHQELHRALDELLADFILHNDPPYLDRPIQDLVEWSSSQLEVPTEEPSR